MVSQKATTVVCSSKLACTKEVSSICILALAIYFASFVTTVRSFTNENTRRPELNFGDVIVSPLTQSIYAQDVIKRLIPDRYSDFEIQVDPTISTSAEDTFIIDYNTESSKIRVRGTTGVSALFGFNHYLKYSCNCHISWEGNQLELPQVLPNVTIRKTILDRFRYYQNVCTDSYSFVWWDWKQWESHIDWMAMAGINLPLAFTGQEAIWQRVYLSLGLSPEDVSNYISGPAFLAWWRMGNVQNWGGPIPQTFINMKLQLLKKILERMRNLGMIPVLPAFSGNVPPTLKKIFPNITLIPHPSWSRFNSTYGTYLLDPTDPIFVDIGQRFMKELIKEVGTNHIYNCDTFNEMTPSRKDTQFLKDAATATYEAMKIVDSQAIWLMQSWVFRDTLFWGREQVQAYLSGVPIGKAIILDLEADRFPLFNTFDSFYGHNFLWCMLQNYGGTNGLYGAFSLVNEGLAAVRNASNLTLVGIGVCPEGINQNYVMYDFMQDISLESSPVQVDNWVERYVTRRYGEKNDFLFEAWEILQEGVYNAPLTVSNHGKTVITRRPGMKLSEFIWYKMDDMGNVLERFINAIVVQRSSSLTNSTLFKHDLVDMTRQFLQVLGNQMYQVVVESYTQKSMKKFAKSSRQLLEILDDLDTILETSPDFLLGKWVNDAERWATGLQEKRLLRYNALNQITLWGPTGEILDYAAKEWAGTVSNYYKPRWELFVQALNTSLVDRKPFNRKGFVQQVLNQIEIPFTLTSQSFPAQPKGDSLEQANLIYQKWKKTYKKMVRRSRRKQQENDNVTGETSKRNK